MVRVIPSTMLPCDPKIKRTQRHVPGLILRERAGKISFAYQSYAEQSAKTGSVLNHFRFFYALAGNGCRPWAFVA